MDEEWHRGGNVRDVCCKLNKGGREVELPPMLDGLEKM
jgi:hypothetical protein